MSQSLFIRISGYAFILGTIISFFFQSLYGSMFLIIGFIGLYFAHKNGRDFWLLCGTILQTLAIASLTILTLINFIHPIFSVNQLSLPHSIAILITYIAYIVGHIILSICIIRRRVFPIWIGVLLLLSLFYSILNLGPNYFYNGCIVLIGYFLARRSESQGLKQN
jgi:hypothetical protein